MPDDGTLVGFFGGLLESCVDVAVRDSAGAQLSGDAKLALLADFGALAGKLFRIARVIDHSLALQTVEHGLDQGFVVGASLQRSFHFVDGMSATHQGAYRGVV